MTRRAGPPRDFALRVIYEARGGVVVDVRGEVDILTAPELGGVLRGVVDRGHTNLVLDFTELDFLDAAGLGVIALIATQLQPSGSLVVRSAPAMTRYILDLTGVSGLVRMEPRGPTRGPAAIPGAHPPTTLLEAAVDHPGTDVVEAALALVVAVARATIAKADGVGVSLQRNGRLMTVASTDHTVERLELHQYTTGQGPCLAAATDGHPFSLEASAEETRWPEFVPAAVAAGIGSVLSMPLVTPARPVGALNLYARSARAFGAREQELATLFATEVSQLLSSATVAPRPERLGERFSDALRSREVIAEGQGVLMERHGLSADAAYVELARAARTAHHPLRQQALSVVASTASLAPPAPPEAIGDGR